MSDQPRPSASVPDSLPTARKNVTRLWRWGLELLTGILLLFLLGLGGVFAWLQTDSSHRHIQRWVDLIIVEHLGEGTTLKFQRTDLGLRWRTGRRFPEIALTLDEVTIAHQLDTRQVSGQIPRLEMVFDTQDIVQQQFTPFAVGFHDMVIPLNPPGEEMLITPQQLLSPLLWWLHPQADSNANMTGPESWHDLPFSDVSPAFQAILPIALREFRRIARVEFHHFRLIPVGETTPLLLIDATLENLPAPAVTARVDWNEPTMGSPGVSGRISLHQRGENIVIDSDISLKAGLLTRWLPNLPNIPTAIRDGVITPTTPLNMHTTFSLPNQDYAASVLELFDNPDDLSILDPINGQLELRWPVTDPKWHARLDKISHQSGLDFALENLKPVTIAPFRGITIDRPLNLNLDGQLDWARRQIGNVALTLASADIEQSASIEMTAPNIELDPQNALPEANLVVIGNNVPLGWFVPLINPVLSPAEMVLEQATAKKITAEIALEGGRTRWLHAEAAVVDWQGTLRQSALTVPSMLLEWQGTSASTQLQLDIAKSFTWQGDIIFANLHLQGDTSNGFTGVTHLALPDRLWQQAKTSIDLPDILPDIGLSHPAELSIRFQLAPDKADPQILSVSNRRPLELRLGLQPVSIDSLRYHAPTHRLNVVGNLGVTEFSIDSQRQQTITADVTLKRVPTQLLRLLPAAADSSPVAAWHPGLWQAEGEFDAVLSATLDPQFRLQGITGAVDLSGAVFNHVQYGPVKNAHQPGDIRLEAQRTKDHLWQVDIALSLPQTTGTATLEWDNARSLLNHLEARDWQWRDRRISLHLQRQIDGVYAKLDTDHWPEMQQFFTDTLIRTDTAINPPDQHDHRNGFPHNLPAPVLPLVALSWQSDTADFNQHRFRRFTLEAKWAKNHHNPASLQMSMTSNAGDSATDEGVVQHRLEFEPGQKLHMVSDNFGQLLRAMDILQFMRGGEGELLLHRDHSSAEESLTGNWRVKDFSVTTTNNAVRLLEAVSLLGLIPTLAREGIPFVVMNAEVSVQSSRWDFRHVRAYGPGLSFTFDGQIDLARETITGKGTTSPTSLLNSVIGNIPILGTLLTGTDDGGLIAANYTINGPIDDPSISSQPISLLQPGLLRNIFGGAGVGVSKQENSPDPP